MAVKHYVPLPAVATGTHLAGGAVRRIFLPAHRSGNGRSSTVDAHRVGPEMKIHGALMQRALRLCRAIALAQIIEPGRAMIALVQSSGSAMSARSTSHRRRCAGG